MHHLRNILTLQVGLAESFERLEIWFDSVEVCHSLIFFYPPDTWPQGHQYDIGKEHPMTWGDLSNGVTFTSAFSDRLALPSQQYLALHASCAKTVCMTGATEFIYGVLDGYEQTEVLSNDGSSSELLRYLLAGAASMVY
jgi:hypothetical protein